MAARMDREEDGSPYVRLQLAITDPVAAQKIADKRYLTGSVGGRAGKAVCSITGEDLASEDASGRPRTARYKRGQVYKGKLSYIDMQDISFKEYSFVNQPADQRSGVRTPKTKEGSTPIANSEDWVAKSSAFVLHMDNEDIISVEENESIFKNMKKKESKPVYLHVKGAFLTALALQESENGNNNESSLLSVEDSVTNNSEETHKMDDVKENEDILAVAEELSEDLSNIAAGTEEVVEEKEAETKESSETEESEKVEEADNSGVAGSLQKVLNNTVVFYFAAHRAHWNVEGENFAEFHELFSSIYEDAIGSVDKLAENMRKLQTFPASLTDVVMSADFKDDSSSTDALALANELLEKNAMVNQSIMGAFTVANEANEQGIANFLAERDDMTKKWSWQLRSSLKMEAGEPADESWRINKSEKAEEKTEEQVNNVDSVNTEVSENTQENDDTKADLTSVEGASEQEAEVSNEKVHALEEENKKLKEALHRTLAERVVDTKITVGAESVEDREELIKDHVTRSASSLADSLRDLVKLPIAKKNIHALSESVLVNDVVSEKEENVLEEDEEIVEAPKSKSNSVEELFVDALMGRRKL
jgi:starvation-inducible DNA-binding protein